MFRARLVQVIHLGPGRLAVLERWLPYAAINLDRLHCNVTRHIQEIYRTLQSTPACSHLSIMATANYN